MRVRFDWGQYITLARELSCCSQSDPLIEAKHRSSISRAYYSVFVPAYNYLRRKQRKYPPKDKGTHKFVIDEFKNSTDQTQQLIGIQLNQLRECRNNADYEDDVPQLSHFVGLALGLADDTAKLLKRL